MDTNNEIVIGGWLCTDEGIGIVERIHHYYYEEFDNIPEDKKLGEHKFSLVEYKTFCYYDGKPIRRNRFKCSNLYYSDPITKKYKNILDKSIKDHPKEYKSFEKFLKEPKHLNDTRMVRYELSEDNKIQVDKVFDKILGALPPKFTFEDVMKKAEEYGCPIDLSKPLISTYFIPQYLLLVMHFTYGEFEGKRILFNRLGYMIREKG